MSSGMRGMTRALVRLEAAAGLGRHCHACRVRLSVSLVDPRAPRTPPADMADARCDFCLSPYKVSVMGCSPQMREAQRLRCSFTLEDQYTDPRARALYLWFYHRPGITEVRAQRRGAVGAKAKSDPNARAYLAMRAEVRKLYARRRRELNRKYGGPPFPEHEEMIRAIRWRERRNYGDVHVPDLRRMEDAETSWLIHAALEKIVWGAALAHTASKLEDIQRRITEASAAAVEEKRRAEDEAARRREEQTRLEKERREAEAERRRKAEEKKMRNKRLLEALTTPPDNRPQYVKDLEEKRAWKEKYGLIPKRSFTG